MSAGRQRERPRITAHGTSRHEVALRKLTSRTVVTELPGYLRDQKLWWMAPMVVVPVLVGALLVFAQGSALAPFVYTLF